MNFKKVELNGFKSFADKTEIKFDNGVTCIVGPNGCGKTTLLRMLAGQLAPDSGTIAVGETVKIGFFTQEFPKVEANVRLIDFMRDIAEYVETPDGRFSASQMLEQFLFPPDVQYTPVERLSGGEKRRLYLASLLMASPNVLLLDEPTNDLDIATLEILEDYLSAFKGAVVVVSHDRYFLDNAAEWILELDRGEGIPWKGNYSSWLDQKEKRLEIEKRQEDARMKAIKHELEWVRQNPKGRQAKSKARIARFEELSSVEYQQRNETNEIFIPVAERLGNDVIEFNHVSKGFGDRLLIDDLSFRIPAGAIVGVIGPNGAGKSTLFKMITGREQPDSGEIKIGTTVKLAAVDQMRDSLPNDKTAFDAVADGQDILQVGKFSMSSRAYLGRFNFKGGDQQKLVGSLSGGERGRLHLAKTLLAGGNVLLLDEPSNDLDVETLRALEEALLEFAGCALVTSHDRWFLDRIATHILAFEGDSRVVFFDGNYNEYEADKRRRLGEEACQPKRLRFKPLKH